VGRARVGQRGAARRARLCGLRRRARRRVLRRRPCAIRRLHLLRRRPRRRERLLRVRMLLLERRQRRRRRLQRARRRGRGAARRRRRRRCAWRGRPWALAGHLAARGRAEAGGRGVGARGAVRRACWSRGRPRVAPGPRRPDRRQSTARTTGSGPLRTPRRPHHHARSLAPAGGGGRLNTSSLAHVRGGSQGANLRMGGRGPGAGFWGGPGGATRARAARPRRDDCCPGAVLARPRGHAAERGPRRCSPRTSRRRRGWRGRGRAPRPC
jgi:hypothetical protein